MLSGSEWEACSANGPTSFCSLGSSFPIFVEIPEGASVCSPSGRWRHKEALGRSLIHSTNMHSSICRPGLCQGKSECKLGLAQILVEGVWSPAWLCQPPVPTSHSSHPTASPLLLTLSVGGLCSKTFGFCTNLVSLCPSVLICKRTEVHRGLHGPSSP